MIRKLRIKIIVVSMLLTTAILAAVFSAVFFTTRQSLEQDSLQVLQRVLLEEERGGRPQLAGPGIQLPFFLVQVSNRTAIVLAGSYYDLDDADQLLLIVNECLEQKETTGLLSGRHLRYLKAEDRMGVRIAFVDATLEESTLRNQLLSSLLIGLCVLALFFALSVLFARWAVRPVEETLRQQRQFLSDASHELKTPLTVILSNAELLEESTQENTQARAWSGNIRSEAVRMKTLVEQMLQLTRAEGRQTAEPVTRQNFSDLLLETILHFEPVAFECGKRISYDIDPNQFVAGRELQLRQLCGILLDNALKYSPEHSSIYLSLHLQGKRLVLLVSNPNQNGPIPEEKLPHLFDRFYRLDDSRGETEGFGLGLPIAAAIVKECHGLIHAESDSQGTRFVVEFSLWRQ